MKTMISVAPAERARAFARPGRPNKRSCSGKTSPLKQRTHNAGLKIPRLVAGIPEGAGGWKIAGHTGSVYFKQIPGTSTHHSPRRRTRMGAVSLVLAICGIAVFWLPWVNLICAVLSMFLGVASLSRPDSRRTGDHFHAAAGLLLGVALFLTGLFVIDIVLSLASVLEP